ncbi:MAG: hypothetical protein JO126_03925 [Alphaproteobacteria bacterium]|nr:hypothetical protein [Alphaproteobacteria bacterium]
MKSENWGGIASLCGSLLFMLAGDSAGITATGICLAAEFIFATRGHRTWGYSLGCALISLCGFFLTASRLMDGNDLLRHLTMVMMVVWAFAAIRWPVEILSNFTATKNEVLAQILRKLADYIPRIASIISITMRLPMLVTAAFAGEHFSGLMFSALTCYLIADVLLGRLQTLLKRGGPGRT